jgi:IS605 OrfB family transposase
MDIRRAYRFRLRPSKAQESLFRQYAGCRRFAWNKALDLQKKQLDRGEKTLGYSRLCSVLPGWKQEHPFLAEAPSQALQQTLKDLDRAIRDAFNKKDPKQFPVFKKKGKITKLHGRIADARRDFLHKATTAISKNHAIVVMEDLQIGNMVRSAKGTIEHPGKKVRQKAGLNRAILDQGWREFHRQVGYKLEWAGGELRLVNPAYTSQECSVCHHVARENRKTRDKFQCVACGHAEDADVNAAKNIKVAGLAASACGGLGASRPPVKQAPPREKERCHAA